MRVSFCVAQIASRNEGVKGCFIIGTGGISRVRGTGCPFLNELDKKLEELHKGREKAINESLSEIREMVRQPDGSCNNINHPEWGKAGTCFHRVLPPAYADGVSQIRVSCNNTELPNARLISMTLHNETNKTDEMLTHLAMIFGQFLTHDITFVPVGMLPSIEFKFGLLISQENDCNEYPPDSLVPNADNCSLLSESMKCSWTGDLRAQQNIGLLSVQTLWLREHNRIAKNLSEINPHWDDERLFQTARRIVEARYQHIVFKEYLPKMIGQENMQEFNLTPLEDGFTTYNESVNPTLTNEFSAAAFRFGHAQVAKNFWSCAIVHRSPAKWRAYSSVSAAPLHTRARALLIMNTLQAKAAARRARNAAAMRARRQDPAYGLDLFAIDIQRGRDHGLRPYVDYVQHCRNITVESFENLTNLMADENNATKLFQQVYK
ncbi:hypothetical protein HPB48_021149 [Haemaphysalis longicornis]|uniref:Chorion peroxidase n=1 Tax=Haemaphysalis longicornis TaxID=44386 RepID=A0A9J6FKE6_HAELO|nr:hypothetical protein HPB48_021149 [Haemaphysalis longicornis]